MKVRKLLSLILSVLMCLSFTAAAAVNSSAQETGAPLEPDVSWYSQDAQSYVISDAEDLFGLSRLVNEDGVDFDGKTIALSGSIALNSALFTPIGHSDEGAHFRGTLDGGGFTISGLSIDNTTATGYNSTGLFGWCEGLIKNLNVSGAVASYTSYNGGIAGFIYQGEIRECSFSGSVSGTGLTAGIVGEARASLIRHCRNYAEIHGSDYLGGIVGTANGSTVINCLNTGGIDGGPENNELGGIVGLAFNSSVGNCYNRGDINGRLFIGGVAGYAQAGASVFNSYSTGAVTGKDCVGGAVGGTFTGANYDDSSVVNCYYLSTDTVNASVPALGEGESAACASFDTLQALTARDASGIIGGSETLLDALQAYVALSDDLRLFEWKIEPEQNDGYPIFTAGYIFTYIVDDIPTSVRYEVGEPIETPDTPVKDGFVFVRWEPEIPAVMPNEDVTVTAVFELSADDITLNVELFNKGSAVLYINGKETRFIVGVPITIKTSDRVSVAAYPASGYRFGSYTALYENLVSELLDDVGSWTFSEDVTVRVSFERIPVLYGVDVTGGTANGKKTFLALEGTFVTLTPDKPDSFGYWALDPQGEILLSAQAKYSFYLTKSLYVYAIDAPAEEASVLMLTASCQKSGTKYKLSYTGSVSVPEGWTLKSAGLILVKNPSADFSSLEDGFTYENSSVAGAKISKVLASSVSAAGQYKITVTGVAKNQRAAVRMFAVCENASGETVYCHSDVSYLTAR